MYRLKVVSSSLGDGAVVLVLEDITRGWLEHEEEDEEEDEEELFCGTSRVMACAFVVLFKIMRDPLWDLTQS